MNTAISASGSVISGAIMMWGNLTIPPGYLECNGQSTVGYPNLILAGYTLNVPDLRDKFIRGYPASGRVLLDT